MFFLPFFLEKQEEGRWRFLVYITTYAGSGARMYLI